jgi:uncharacterized short protein YbdD (DUF466 family)
VTSWWKRGWAALRELSGDDAYDRYIAHWHARHAASAEAPLDRREFFKENQRRKWEGVKRCC